jgi:hypothetical protein
MVQCEKGGLAFSAGKMPSRPFPAPRELMEGMCRSSWRGRVATGGRLGINRRGEAVQADGSATWDQPGRGRKSMNDGGFIIETRLVVMRCIAGAVSVEIGRCEARRGRTGHGVSEGVVARAPREECFS